MKRAGKSEDRSASRRKGEKSAADLRVYAAQLESRAGDLRSLASSMEKLTLDSVTFDGIKKADNGLEMIDEFLTRVEAAVSAAKKRIDREV